MADNPTTACPMPEDVCADCGYRCCETDHFWDDGTRITAKQRADGAAWADTINALLARRANG